MKTGQPALRRTTSFQIKSDDSLEQTDIIYEGNAGTVTLRQGTAYVVLSMAEVPLAIEALEHIFGDAGEVPETPANPKRTRTDVVGAILAHLEKVGKIDANASLAAADLVTRLGLKRDQIVAALGRMKKSGRLRVVDGSLVRQEDVPL